jgi:hypothetical protein
MVLFSIFSLFEFPSSVEKRKGKEKKERKIKDGGGKLFRGSAGASRPSA